MTDNDIIKALECCIKSSHFGECFENKCPLVSEEGCSAWTDDKLLKDALDLINRQKAENKELNHKYALAVAEREANVKGFTEQLSKIRAEAITEFAKRLKKYYNRLDNSQGNLISFHIDQIAKEMKEGVNNA